MAGEIRVWGLIVSGYIIEGWAYYVRTSGLICKIRGCMIGMRSSGFIHGEKDNVRVVLYVRSVLCELGGYISCDNI